jgi:hypothetical protein
MPPPMDISKARMHKSHRPRGKSIRTIERLNALAGLGGSRTRTSPILRRKVDDGENRQTYPQACRPPCRHG